MLWKATSDKLILGSNNARNRRLSTAQRQCCKHYRKLRLVSEAFIEKAPAVAESEQCSSALVTLIKFEVNPG